LRLRYYFENFIARKSNFVYFLFVASILFALLMLILEISLGMVEEGNFFNLWYTRLERLLVIDGSGTEPMVRVVNLFYWLFSLAFSGTIIAFLAAKIASFIEDLKKGHSSVIDVNHYVIIGWNATIFKVFDEIRIANENQLKPTVLCFNSMDNIEMNAKINLEYPNRKNIRIITRSGDIYSSQDLARTNMTKAKAVIVLDDNLTSNFNVETTILAVKINISKARIPVIAQMSENVNIELINNIFAQQVYPIHKNKIIANVTAQSIRNKHISAIVLDFLDYDGDEIYFFPADKLAGCSYKTAMLALNDVTLIGIKQANSSVHLNPDKNYLIKNDDLLVVIAEDDDVEVNIDLGSDKMLEQIQISSDCIINKETISMLVLGWSELGQHIVQQALPFLSMDSNLHIAYNDDLVKEKPKVVDGNNVPNKIENIKGDELNMLNKILTNNVFDVIMILGYNDIQSPEISDTNSLLLNSYIQSILSKQNQKQKSNTRIIVQLTDGSKEGLIESNSYNELIVSDTLSSLVITQLADNPSLWHVFEELFSDSGLKICVSPFSDYNSMIAPNQISVKDLILLALEKNQTFIGFVYQDKLNLNPPKSTEIIIDESLFLVYLA